MKTYGARHPNYRSAPKPANFDELTAAAAARRDAAEANDPTATAQAQDAFAAEYGKYRDQANRAGVHPGTLLGLLEDNGDVS
ncbi:MAG: hypothetical protein HIU88_10130 [Acidobacteria bacterium]|nr:hypothetical protein [Acidobacteriota bacterium]